MKRILLTTIFILLISINCFSADRVTLQDGDGSELGTAANPMEVSVVGDPVVTSSANITDNAVVRGDGGAKGVQDSGVIIDDSDNVTGINDLTITGTYYGIKDEMVIMDYPSGSTEYTLDDYLNDTQAAGWVSGGAFTDDGDGTMTVAAGVGVIKMSVSDTGANLLIDFSETALSPDNEVASYVYVDYNGGSPIVSISTTNVSNGTTKFNLGQVFREGTDLHFFRAGQVVSNFSKRVLQRFNSDGNIQLKAGGIVTESGTAFTLVVTEAT